MNKNEPVTTTHMTPQEHPAGKAVVLPRTIHLVPMDYISGFEVRPGFYEINGATAIPGGVNFTVYSVCRSSFSGPLSNR